MVTMYVTTNIYIFYFKFEIKVYYLVSGNIVPDPTDHFSQFCILQSTLPKATPERLSLLESILSSLIIDFCKK